MIIWIAAALIALGLAPWVIERSRRPMDETLRAHAPGQFARLSQGVTHFRWLGPTRGPVAVCVHGLTTPSPVWSGIAAGLARLGFRVLVYDLYGRGYSDRVQGPQDMAFFLRQLEDLLEHEGVESDITLLGYSMGGAIVTGYAAAAPDEVQRLILIAPAGMDVARDWFSDAVVKHRRLGDGLMQAFGGVYFRRGLRGVASQVDGLTEAQIAETRRRGFLPAVLSSMRGVLESDLQDAHRTISRNDIPVLAVWGRDDAVIPITAMGKLAQWNRVAHQEVIAGAGHGLPYTHVDAVSDQISQFIVGQ